MDRIREIFYYLDELRATGLTNMYGAGAYLIQDFDLDDKESRAILHDWMRTFDPDKTVEERIKLL